MRRNVTVSLDEEFVVWVDGCRGVMPRSRFIEAVMRTPSKEPGSPGDGTVVSVGGKPGYVGHAKVRLSKAERLEVGRAIVGDQEKGRHLATCRCGVCQPVKS